MSEEDSIIREVEEDLRRERYERLWKKYGPFVIGTAVVVLVSMLGWQQWQAYQDRQRAKEAESFLAAVDLMEQGKEAAAANAFGELAGKAGPGYRAVSRLHEAEAYLEQGNSEKALEALDALAADGSVNPKLRALAALKGGLLVADTASPDELKKRLTPALRPRSPWRFAAQELVAFGHYRTGDFAEARNAYQTLVNQFDAPSHIRERARNMVALISSEEAQGLGGKTDSGDGKAQEGETPDAGNIDESGLTIRDLPENPDTDEEGGGQAAAPGDAEEDQPAEGADGGSAENGASAGETAVDDGDRQ